MNTDDTDVAYSRTPENHKRLAAALAELDAPLRGPDLPPDLPFAPDAETLRRGATFTFTTTHGVLDTSGIQPVRTVSRLLADAVEAEIADVRVRVASLDHLIAMKEAAGRPRDKLAAMEYRQLSDELRAP